MRLLIVAHSFPPYINGVSTAWRARADGLARRGHELRLLVPACPERTRSAATGYSIVEYPVVDRPQNSLTIFPRPARRTYGAAERRAFDDFAPDAVFVSDPVLVGFYLGLLNIPCRRAAKRTRTRAIALYETDIVEAVDTNRHGILHFASRGLIHSYMAWAHGGFDVTVTPTRHFQQHVEAAGVPRARHQPLFGVDLATFVPSHDSARTGPLRLVHYGRLSTEKRASWLAQALAPCLDLPGFGSVTFIGHGDDVEHITALQRRHPDKVIVLPPLPQTDIVRHLQQADVFVTASEFETFGLVILESMACGVVPLVPRIAAYDELLAGGRAGFTYTPRDARDFLETICQLCIGRATLHDRRRYALAESQRHGWDAVVEGLEDVARGQDSSDTIGAR